jgi:hypothetical protein
VDTGIDIVPCQERVTPGVHLKSKREAIVAAYLRAAHAYMLISMPTGTSTIFGVFQAILALLANGTNSALSDKVMGYENFASEIFWHKRGSPNAAVQKEIHLFVRLGVKPKTDQRVQSRIARSGR